VVLDEPTDLEGEAPGPGGVRDGYVFWVRRFADRAATGESFWETRLAQSLGILILLAIIAANLWLCWAVWDPDASDEARPAAPSRVRVE